MALSTAIFVGKSQEWIPEIVERAKQLKTNAGEGGRGEGRGRIASSFGPSCSHDSWDTRRKKCVRGRSV